MHNKYIRKVSSAAIMTVSEESELQENLRKDQDAFVAYIEGKDSIGFILHYPHSIKCFF